MTSEIYCLYNISKNATSAYLFNVSMVADIILES